MQKIRKFFELKGSDIKPGLWMPFESSISSMYVPHIFSGLPHEIEGMFFEDNPVEEHLEMIDLPCLNKEDSIKLFSSLCEMYNLRVELEPADFVGTFGGNPFYIKNFLQAARQTGGVLSKDVFYRTYNNEITSGKTYKYWTFLLKKHIQRLDLRKPSLKFLHGFCSNNSDDSLQLEEGMFEHILEILHDSGSVETGFSKTTPSDEVLRDIIKELYREEVQNESPENVSDPIAEIEGELAGESGVASFIIMIPADPKAGLVAIKSLEQISRNNNIPLKDMGKLQLAMADLFANVFDGDAPVENYKLQIRYIENLFSVELTTPQKDLVITEQDTARIRAYIDDLKVESIENGTVITLVKEIS